LFEKDFEVMLRKYGDAIDDKKRFMGLIKDCFSEQTKIINTMLMAYDLGIAQQIQSVDKLNNAFAYRFVKQLTDDYGLSRANADWVTAVWCVCYGKDILGKECEITLQMKNQPAITVPEKKSGGTYGDLFRYKASSLGAGLAVCGFSGDTSHTVIFQNVSNGKPVIEICDSVFSGKDIEEIIITEGYSYIGKSTFEDNKRLHQIVMPYSMTDIGDHAFAGCIELHRVNLTERLEKIGDGAFKGTGLRTVVFPKSLYYVGNEAFADCTELDNLAIPANLDWIADRMFENCISLKKIEILDGISVIGNRAFAGCSSLDIVTIPDSINSIGDNAFEGVDEKFILQCSFGSYAESFARKRSIKYQLI